MILSFSGSLCIRRTCRQESRICLNPHRRCWISRCTRDTKPSPSVRRCWEWLTPQSQDRSRESLITLEMLLDSRQVAEALIECWKRGISILSDSSRIAANPEDGSVNNIEIGWGFSTRGRFGVHRYQSACSAGIFVPGMCLGTSVLAMSLQCRFC